MPHNSYFQFKQFRIIQERSAMKVGMDGVLLGAWADVSGTKRILDVGTGTGLIALMMAQKNHSAQIDAIEIDPDAFQEAQFNVGQSPWPDRVALKCMSFQEFARRSQNKYDLILSNPPYFAGGMKARDASRAKARHADALPLPDLISGAVDVLAETGKIALVLPSDSLQELVKLAETHKLSLSRLCRVRPNPDKPNFRILAEIGQRECNLTEEELVIEFEKHHHYTPEYRELTKEFYLKF
jgi:tRNA1Val (adenine37-N6)-methyltransferase